MHPVTAHHHHAHQKHPTPLLVHPVTAHHHHVHQKHPTPLLVHPVTAHHHHVHQKHPTPLLVHPVTAHHHHVHQKRPARRRPRPGNRERARGWSAAGTADRQPEVASANSSNAASARGP